METIAIHTEFIKLQDLLKFAGAPGTGGEANHLIQAGQVSFNCEVCLPRGKKLRPGDVVSLNGRELTVTHADQ